MPWVYNVPDKKPSRWGEEYDEFTYELSPDERTTSSLDAEKLELYAELLGPTEASDVPFAAALNEESKATAKDDDARVVLDELIGPQLLQHASPSPLDLRRNNPLPPVDWRWHMAKCLRQNILPQYWQQADEHVLDAHALQVKVANCTNPEDLQAISEGGPPEGDMFSAFMIWRKNLADRHELEARLLAKQAPDEIANCMGLTASCVDFYRLWFFTFVDSPFYVTHVVLRFYQGPSMGHFDVWKLIGYSAGIDALDVLLSPVPDPEKFRNSLPFFLQLMRWRLSTAASLSAMGANTTCEKKAFKLFRLYNRLRKLEKQEEARESQDSDCSLGAHLDAFFRQNREMFGQEVQGRSDERLSNAEDGKI